MTYTEKITDLFLLIALSFGLVLVFLVPPFQSPDETNHFKRAYQLSKGHFFSDKTEHRIGGYLPKSIDVLCDTFLYLKNDVKAKINFSQLQSIGQMPLGADKLQFSDFPNTAIYAPIGYIPQAIGIALLRWAEAPVLYLLYAARICNLLVWCMLIWFSLRTIHFGRPLLAVLALLPSSLAIASSANPDVLCNALSWYMIACVLANLPWNRLGVVAYWMLCLQKLIAWPLGLLLLGKLDRQRATKYGTIWILFVGLALALAWGNYAQTSFISYHEYDPEWRDKQTLNPGVNPQEQLGFIIEQPIFFIKTISKSMLYAVPSMAAHVVGKFGWEKNYLPAPVLVLLWMAILGLAFLEKWKVPLVVKLWAGAAVAAYWLAFSITMYALWCPVGADILDNWQARYFTPILPLCFLLIAQDYLSHWRKWVINAAFGVVIMGNVILIWSVWMRYVV